MRKQVMNYHESAATTKQLHLRLGLQAEYHGVTGKRPYSRV